MPSAGCRLSLVICRIKWFSSFCRRRIKGAAHGSRVLPLITYVGMQQNLSLRHIFIASSEFVDGSRASHVLDGWSLNLNLISSLISENKLINMLLGSVNDCNSIGLLLFKQRCLISLINHYLLTCDISFLIISLLIYFAT